MHFLRKSGLFPVSLLIIFLRQPGSDWDLEMLVGAGLTLELFSAGTENARDKGGLLLTEGAVGEIIKIR